MTESRNRTEWPLWLDWFVNLFLWMQTQEELMEREEYGIFHCQGSSCALVNGIYDIYALLCKQNCCVPGWGSRAHLPKGAAETKQAEHGLTDLCRNQSCCCLCRNHHFGEFHPVSPFGSLRGDSYAWHQPPNLPKAGQQFLMQSSWLPRTRLTHDFPLSSLF